MKLVRRPYNGRGIMEPAVRAPIGARWSTGLFVTENVTVTQVSLLYRFASFVLLASIAGVAIDIKNRVGCANKRPNHSLVTFAQWGEPNVRPNCLVKQID